MVAKDSLEAAKSALKKAQDEATAKQQTLAKAEAEEQQKKEALETSGPIKPIV